MQCMLSMRPSNDIRVRHDGSKSFMKKCDFYNMKHSYYARKRPSIGT